jgi:hypothetical protein
MKQPTGKTDVPGPGSDPGSWPAISWRFFNQYKMDVFSFIKSHKANILVTLGILTAIGVAGMATGVIKFNGSKDDKVGPFSGGQEVHGTRNQSINAPGAKIEGDVHVGDDIHNADMSKLEKLAGDSFPQDDHPAVDLSKPIKEQIRLFAEDKVSIVGYTDHIDEVWFGNRWERVAGHGHVYVVWGNVGEPVYPQFKGTGTVKLEVSYTRYRDQPRDLRPPTEEGTLKP